MLANPDGNLSKNPMGKNPGGNLSKSPMGKNPGGPQGGENATTILLVVPVASPNPETVLASLSVLHIFPIY